MKFNFIIGHQYSRKNVKEIIKHPEPDSTMGNWGNGYPSYKNCYFIFANLGVVAGRTGHNYPNQLIGDTLYWFSNGASIDTDKITKMMSGKKEVYIFTRDDNSEVKFIFQGLAYVKDFEDIKPAHVVWGITDDLSSLSPEFKGEKRKRFIEGARTEYLATRYERNQKAREECLRYYDYAYSCLVCEINFEKIYGDIGSEYIHVHHVVEISTIGKAYEIDPIKDLKPVCPNCHAMIHRAKPALTIEKLKGIMKSQK